ncbi:hypothetical protein WMO24_02950, partial [Ruthenibacterium sp. CLA-JM-H11]
VFISYATLKLFENSPAQPGVFGKQKGGSAQTRRTSLIFTPNFSKKQTAYFSTSKQQTAFRMEHKFHLFF